MKPVPAYKPVAKVDPSFKNDTNSASGSIGDASRQNSDGPGGKHRSSPADANGKALLNEDVGKRSYGAVKRQRSSSGRSSTNASPVAAGGEYLQNGTSSPRLDTNSTNAQGREILSGVEIKVESAEVNDASGGVNGRNAVDGKLLNSKASEENGVKEAKDDFGANMLSRGVSGGSSGRSSPAAANYNDLSSLVMPRPGKNYKRAGPAADSGAKKVKRVKKGRYVPHPDFLYFSEYRCRFPTKNFPQKTSRAGGCNCGYW
jgi:hypothetical protein